jgi:hypothetical protein
MQFMNRLYVESQSRGLLGKDFFMLILFLMIHMVQATTVKQNSPVL